MEQLKNENVSVKSDSLNRGCTENLVPVYREDVESYAAFFDFLKSNLPDIKGCYSFGSDRPTIFRTCSECKAGIFPDLFPCALDVPDSDWYPLYYDPRDKYAFMREEVFHE